MTALEIILLVANAIWIFAYLGACTRANKAEQQAEVAIAQAENVMAQAETAVTTISQLQRALDMVLFVNKKLYTALGNAMDKIDNEGEEWKRGRIE